VGWGGFLSGETSPSNGQATATPVREAQPNFLGKAIIEPPFREWKVDAIECCGVLQIGHYLCMNLKLLSIQVFRCLRLFNPLAKSL
jgi:hypothetical protein